MGATPEPVRPQPDIASAEHANLVPSPEPTQAPRVTELPAPTPFAPPRDLVRSVRFDVGYYYGQGKSAPQLAEELTRSWASKGINLVYFYAFNRVYGARYYTRYSKLALEDYGRQDLLKHLLREAHARGIKVIAWFYGPQSKQMWEAHPNWRQKTADGKDYRPDGDSYPLCVHNPQVVQWWLGLIGDLLDRYPDLDGVDIAEAQIDLWGDTACHCEHCQSHLAGADSVQAWRMRRAEGLTEFILATNRLVRSHGKESHLTAVFTARPDGRLMTSADIRDATGFDLQSILNSPDRPDVIQAELIWQQWAALYASSSSFSPSWTEAAVRQAKEIVAGRSRVTAHIEATDFGKGGLDGPSIHRTVAAAVAALPYGVDIYDAHLLESIDGATGYLRTAWLTSS